MIQTQIDRQIDDKERKKERERERKEGRKEGREGGREEGGREKERKPTETDSDWAQMLDSPNIDFKADLINTFRVKENYIQQIKRNYFENYSTNTKCQ